MNPPKPQSQNLNPSKTSISKPQSSQTSILLKPQSQNLNPPKPQSSQNLNHPPKPQSQNLNPPKPQSSQNLNHPPKMPVKRIQGARLKLITSGVSGGTVSRMLSSSANIRFSQFLRDRPNRLRMPPRPRDVQPADEPLLQYSAYEAEEGSTDGFPQGYTGPIKSNSGPIIGDILHFRRSKPKEPERKAQAENWAKAEHRMVLALLSNDELQCNCATRESVEVRHVTTESKCTVKYKPYCFNEPVAAYITNANCLDQSISSRICQCAYVGCLAPYWCSEGGFHHLQSSLAPYSPSGCCGFCMR